jgi:hypothetical protein
MGKARSSRVGWGGASQLESEELSLMWISCDQLEAGGSFPNRQTTNLVTRRGEGIGRVTASSMLLTIAS